MRKQFIIALSTLIFCHMSFAEQCPSVQDIKHNQLKSWKAFDCEDGQPLSNKRFSEFRSGVEAFALAEWVKEGSTGGAMHCYYRSSNGSDLDAYLSKSHYRPDNRKDFWYQVSGAMQCAAGSARCQFQAIEPPKQFANHPKTHIINELAQAPG